VLRRRRGGRRARRGSLFPRRRDLAYWRWLGEELARGRLCDACGMRRAMARAHLVPRSRGGGDRDNVVLLCDGPGGGCHRRQEKRTEAFVRETGVDLWAVARAHTERYERDLERLAGLPF
jgi:5-methylcytosine-specific restriction endonuclease McrA